MPVKPRAQLAAGRLPAHLDQVPSVLALSEYLGHTDPGFTLRTYTHLMPSSEDRTRKAIDRVFDGAATADGLKTA